MASNFGLGLGCIFSPVDCYKINQELNRLALKISKGEPLTPEEKEWVTGYGPELEEEAAKMQRRLTRPISEALKGLLWPVLIVGAAFLLIKGKIA